MTFNTITRTFDGIATETVHCWCSINFVIPRALYQFYQRENEAGRKFCLYCPLGHSMIPAGQSEADRLRDELAREKHRTEQARADAEHQRERVTLRDRRLAARKGQITKLRKRISNGVCPCCNRTFTNLQRHMSGQHPDWAPEHEHSLATLPAVSMQSDWATLRACRVALGLPLYAVGESASIKGSTLAVYEHGGASSERARRRVAEFLIQAIAERDAR